MLSRLKTLMFSINRFRSKINGSNNFFISVIFQLQNSSSSSFIQSKNSFSSSLFNPRIHLHHGSIPEFIFLVIVQSQNSSSSRFNPIIHLLRHCSTPEFIFLVFSSDLFDCPRPGMSSSSSYSSSRSSNALWTAEKNGNDELDS